MTSIAAEVAFNRMVPPATVKLPVKLVREPKERVVPAATPDALAFEIHKVFPTMLVMIDPPGILVPETVIPMERPRVEATTNDPELTVPTPMVVVVPPITVAVEEGAYTHVPVSALKTEVAPPF